MPIDARRSAAAALLTCAALVVALLAAFKLERARAGLDIDTLMLGSTPVTRYRAADAATAPLVIIAHGYAGSRQLMEALSLTLARGGFDVLAFDFIGHGRHLEAMSPDVMRLEGTTAQLVAQSRTVMDAARALTGSTGPIALVGHSMATDIIIRAAKAYPDIAAIVAISMYSELVTAAYPESLLIVSGAWEPGLRAVALDALRQFDESAEEGETVATGGRRRRAVAAPRVEHVGVLFSPVTLRETRDWIAAETRWNRASAPTLTGPWLLALLVALVLLYRPLAARLAVASRSGPPGGARPGAMALSTARYFAVLMAPVLPALAVAVAAPLAINGLAGFAPLTGFLASWGLVQLVLLARFGVLPARPAWSGFVLLLAWGLAVFALALDRYGAAFVPVGPRLLLLALMLPGCVLFTLADALLTAGAPLWRRGLARLLPLSALVGAMLFATESLGLVFTAAPVMLLFWLAYGAMGRWTARFGNATTAGLGLGVLLAWSLAASTPLFKAG